MGKSWWQAWVVGIGEVVFWGNAPGGEEVIEIENLAQILWSPQATGFRQLAKAATLRVAQIAAIGPASEQYCEQSSALWDGKPKGGILLPGVNDRLRFGKL